MSFQRGALLLVLAGLALAAPAAAQITGRPIEIAGSGGTIVPDGRAHIQTGIATQGVLGLRLTPGVTLEAHGSFGASHSDTLPKQRHNFTGIGLDLRWNLRPAEARSVPYLLAGAGYGISHTTGHEPLKLERGAPDLGIGLLRTLWSQRVYLRLEARDVMFRERDAVEFSHHLFATAGIQLAIGSKPHDSDLDGVRDWLDTCPGTPLGATVNAQGCPRDADGDGVLDGIDQCAATPKGCTVDAKGCTGDADGDGVCDVLDKCAGTPRGAKVDANGCPIDSDRDGVFDGLDHCDNTLTGCSVDSAGCPHDADGDGVCDGVDVCPNTPSGVRIDVHGCPIEVTTREIQLLDTGNIRLQNIQFDTGQATVKAESYALLDSVGAILVGYPTLMIEIGGHTDDRGGSDRNQKLSEARASAVLTYLEQKYPALDAKQFTAKGYGMSSPIAPNLTALGRARNRRVEFKVMNPGALRIERERRHFLLKNEAMPADTTSH